MTTLPMISATDARRLGISRMNARILLRLAGTRHCDDRLVFLGSMTIYACFREYTLVSGNVRLFQALPVLLVSRMLCMCFVIGTVVTG